MNRTTMIAVAVFGILGIATVVSLNRKAEKGVTRVSFAEVTAESLTKVEITGKNEVTLTKNDETWKLANGREADKNLVKRMVESIPQITSSDVVTRDSGRFEDLEVNEEKGVRVKAYAGSKVVADFVVGKGAPGGANILHDDAVYAVAKVSPSNFNREASAWLERKLFQTKVEEVAKVEVAPHGSAPYVLVPGEDSKWKLEDASVLPEGFRFDPNAARNVVSGVVNLRAKDILDEDPGAEKTKLGAEFDVVKFTTKGDSPQTHEVRLGGTEEGAVYAQVVGRDIVTLYESSAKTLRKPAQELRDMKLMTVDREKVSKIQIVDGSDRLTLEKKGADWTVSSYSKPIPDAFELDPNTVVRRISQVMNARAVQVAEDVTTSAAGLSRPVAKVTVSGDGLSATLAFGKEFKDESRDVFYASGNADNAVYVVTKYVRDSTAGMLDTFEKKAGGGPGMGGMPGGLGNLDPKALAGLPPEVRASLEKQIQQQQQQQKMIEQLQKQQEQKPQ